MVGKGVEPKISRIFQQCYVKCCKLQNLTPLNNVIPSGNGKVLDFVVDRIKYTDWPPILNALSCDLSLHSISIRCRQQVKTVLEHIDCERLAKTVNSRSVVLTNFMLTNLIEAISQLLSNTTLLATLLLEGLPLKIPYLNPLSQAIIENSSLQHLHLPRCLIGDAGCLAVCKAVRCLPNIITLDLSGCELTPLGAGYIADLVKYQKIHRYSENWIHTLRYRLPELDTMAGLRRITLCGNPQLGDVGVGKLLDVLADDLWIKDLDRADMHANEGCRRPCEAEETQLDREPQAPKGKISTQPRFNSALDIQNCSLTERTVSMVLHMMKSNTTLVVIDLRHNADIPCESLSNIRASLRKNERGIGGQYSWLSNVSRCSSEGKLVKFVAAKNGITKDRVASNTKNAPTKYISKSNGVKKEKDYAEILEEQLQEEICHRQHLEELNLQLVEQMKMLKQQQIRLWANGDNSPGSERSLQASFCSCDLSSSSGSSSSVPIDQNTLSYIQQAFKDIYAFIKNNQCYGQCLYEPPKDKFVEQHEEIQKQPEVEEYESDLRINIVPKKAQSAHQNVFDSGKAKKMTKSAHMLGDMQQSRAKDASEVKLEMIERQMGDMRNSHGDDQVDPTITAQAKPRKSSVYSKSSSCDSEVSDSSDTLVCSREQSRRSRVSIRSRTPIPSPTINPRDAFYSTDEEDD